MPVPKDKLVAKLNEKYKGRSLSKDFKNKLADKWAEKIESEEDIDSYIDDRDDIILETISESDRRAKQAADKAKDEAAKAIKGEKVEEPKEVELPDDTPQWMKLFILKQNETIEALNKKVETFQTARSQETLAERFNKIEGFDKIPEKIRNRFIPKREDEFEANKAELAETWNALGVENRAKRFGLDRSAANPNQSSSKNDDKPYDLVRAFAKAQNDKFLNSQKLNYGLRNRRHRNIKSNRNGVYSCLARYKQRYSTRTRRLCIKHNRIGSGDVLLRGTPLVFDESTRIATVLHVGIAQAVAGGSATAYQVYKGSTLKVGDNLASGAVGGKAYPITSIDTSNAAYDVLNVGTSIGAVAVGDTLYASTATGATASALPAANGLLYEETQVFPTGLKNSVSAVIRGTCYARRVPYSAAIAALTGLRFIIYSQSF